MSSKRVCLFCPEVIIFCDEFASLSGVKGRLFFPELEEEFCCIDDDDEDDFDGGIDPFFTLMITVFGGIWLMVLSSSSLSSSLLLSSESLLLLSLLLLSLLLLSLLLSLLLLSVSLLLLLIKEGCTFAVDLTVCSHCRRTDVSFAS